MKRILIALALMVPLALPVAMTGCKAASTTTTPQILAPGYQNAADQQMGQILAAARSFYSTVQCETQSMNWQAAPPQCIPDPSITTPLVLTPAEKSAFNAFGTALNSANLVYLAYHAGAASQAEAQAAVNSVQQQQAALPIPRAK